MVLIHRCVAAVLIVAMIGSMAPLDAKTRKGDRLLSEGRAHEEKKAWDAALVDYEGALSEDPAEAVYQMAVQKARFEASAMHLANGLKIRARGQLGEALLEFQKAFAASPDSTAAEQEIARTAAMIERERKRVEETGRESPPGVRGLTPIDVARQEVNDRIDRLLPIPELNPLRPAIQDFKLNSMTPKLLFDALALNAGINAVYDAEFLTAGTKDKFSVTFNNTTVQEALDYVAALTKSYWKALSPNTIFVTMDNATKRKDYEDEVARVFYLANTTSNAELTTLTTVIRTVADCQRILPVDTQNALVLRCSGDKMALAEKLIHDLDKPRSEVVLDIFVIEASSAYVRNLTTAIASTGLNLAASFTPRSILQNATATTTSSTTTSTSTSSTSTSDSSSSGSSTATAIPFSHIGQVNAGDFSTVLPSALFQATLSDTRTKVLQSPQIRSVDGQKASMKIGEREPTATGSSQSGVSTVSATGVSALVNTQFTYLDVGVNVEVLPHVHENGDISLHVSLDISSVTSTTDIGGINEPVIGQRKIEHDIRLREGEVSLLGGLLSLTDSKVKTGTPGLANIPLLGRLFSGESVDRERDELLVALIPHIVRRPDITPENIRGINVGAGNQVTVHRAPKVAEAAPAVPPAQVPVNAAPAGPVPPATAPPEDPHVDPAAIAPPTERGARIRFREAQLEKKAGENFDLTLQVEGVEDLVSAPIALQFDPQVLTLEGVTPGDIWSGGGVAPVVTKSLQNDAGAANIRLSRPPGSSGVGGTGVLLTLHFKATRSGTATVAVSSLALHNAREEAIGSGTPRSVITVR